MDAREQIESPTSRQFEAARSWWAGQITLHNLSAEPHAPDCLWCAAITATGVMARYANTAEAQRDALRTALIEAQSWIEFPLTATRSKWTYRPANVLLRRIREALTTDTGEARK